MGKNTLRQDGKRDWTSEGCIDQIKVGAIQRIADALERTAGNAGAIMELNRRVGRMERRLAKMAKEEGR